MHRTIGLTDQRTRVKFTLVSINAFALHLARLLLGWVTAYRQVNRIGM